MSMEHIENNHSVNYEDNELITETVDLFRRFAGNVSSLDDVNPFFVGLSQVLISLADQLGNTTNEDNFFRACLFWNHNQNESVKKLLNSLGKNLINNSLKSLSPEQVLKVFDETNHKLLRESSQAEINSEEGHNSVDIDHEEAKITTSCSC